MRVLRGKPGDRLVIDTACSTAQSYQVRILAIRLGPGANFVVPRLVYTPTLSPDDAWSTSGQAPAYRFDPGPPFSLTTGGSLYIESDPMTDVSGGASRPNNVTSEIAYEVTTYGTGLNDSIHKSNHDLTCTYPIFRAETPLFPLIPVGAFDLELISNAATPAITLTYGIGGAAIPVILSRAAGARSSLGNANTILVTGIADDAVLIYHLRLPGA